MALISCPSCGKPLSDKALKCPHCGLDVVAYNKGANQPVNNQSAVNQPAVNRPIADQPVVNQSENNNSSYVEAGLYESEYHPWYKANALWIVAGLVAIAGVVGYLIYDKVNEDSEYDYGPVAQSAEEQYVSVEDSPSNVNSYSGQSNKDRIKNFQTEDLATFMVHGKVKRLTVYNRDNSSWVYSFGRDGSLTSVISKRGDKVYDDGIRVSHNYGNVRLRYTYGESEYEVDSNNRLRKHTYEAGKNSYVYTYSDYNRDGLPTEMETAIYKSGELKSVKNQSFYYSDFDEYGNWRSNGENTRTIEYYSD